MQLYPENIPWAIISYFIRFLFDNMKYSIIFIIKKEICIEE